jgi:lipopolysaccharide transport system permease protein
MREIVYTPDSPLRDPGKLLREMLRDLVASRELAWRLFVRDTRAQYRTSILGYVWVFLPPMAASLPFVFLNAQGVVSVGNTPIAYGAYALIGTIIWQTFVDSLNVPLRTTYAARSLLTRINFPREALLLSGLMQVGFSFLVRLALLALVLIWFQIALPTTAILFPVGILALVLAGFVIGLALTPFGLLYGDVQQALPILTTLLMLLTPVLYPVPETGLAAAVAALNPLTPLVVNTRDWLTTGQIAPVSGFIVVSATASALLLLGWICYRVALPHLVARLGN